MTSDNVIRFPDQDPDRPEVIDAEIVDDTTTDTVSASSAPGVELVRHPLGRMVPADERVGLLTNRQRARLAEGTVIVAHRAIEKTPQVGRGVGRHVLYPVLGAGVVYRRWRDAHGAGRYERMMARHEAAGDEDALRYWQEADVAEKARRHSRAMDWLAAPVQLVKALGVGALAILALLLGLGFILAVADRDAGMILAPIGGVIEAIRWTYWAVVVYGIFAVYGGTAAALAYLWHTGKHHARVPSWAAPVVVADDDAGRGMVPDEGAILTALRHLGISKLNEAFKQGWVPRWISGTCRDGKGWHTQLQLPLGVPVEDIVKKKDTLAHNLMRKPVEVWPTEPRNQPTVLDLWVADQGALSGPLEPWPLLAEGSADFFTGVPVGVDIRGDLITARLFEANYAVAGMMGSGKSSLVITLLAGAVLDPLVEVDVFVFAENADYDPMTPRLRSLHTGSDEDTLHACLHTLRELFSELATRGAALKAHGERKVSRTLAQRDPRLRPRIVVIDECQNLFLSQVGAEAAEIAQKLVSTARKYGIVLVFITPEPSTDSLPRSVVTLMSNKACFAIGDQRSNDAILGTGAYKAGISAVSLEPKTTEGPGDVGTAMATGFKSRPGLMRCFYLNEAELTTVITRATTNRDHAGITTDHDATEPPPVVDPLTDIAAILDGTGVARMRTQQVLHHLAQRNPGHYQRWTFTDLTAYLADYDAEPYKSGGHMVVSSARIHEAITERDHNNDAGSEGAD